MCLNPAPRGHAVDWLARPTRIICCVEGNRLESPGMQGGTSRQQATDSGAHGMYPNDQVFSMPYLPGHATSPFRPSPRCSAADMSRSTRRESRSRGKARLTWSEGAPEADRQAWQPWSRGRPTGLRLWSDTVNTRPEGWPAARPGGPNGRGAGTARACPHSRARGIGDRTLRPGPGLLWFRLRCGNGSFAKRERPGVGNVERLFTRARSAVTRSAHVPGSCACHSGYRD